MNLPIANEAEMRRDLARMKQFATGLLLGMVCLFAVALALEEQYAWAAFVRAFAEAAMVGALADWFAVTALFRHPLNVPIPHTAIIRKNKDRIGASLGNFVQNNFLTPEVIAGKLDTMDIPHRMALWLAAPENAEEIAHRVTAVIPEFLNALKHDDVQRFLEENIAARVRALEVAPLAGNVLSAMTTNNRHQFLLDEALKVAERVLNNNKDFIRRKIEEESPWYVPKFVDNRIYDTIISKAEQTLREVNLDNDHELRQKFNVAVQNFIQNLRHSDDYRQKIEVMKEDLLANPLVRQYFSSLWADVKYRIVTDAERPDSNIRQQIYESLQSLSASLLNDEQVRNRINTWLRDILLSIIINRKSEITAIISDTVKKWDADTMSDRVELYIGRDLQFIRINGTIVGGMVGLLIYCVVWLVKHW
ncbi:MAG: DUF445 domain-containing protein [Candidatus Kapabacteria bacterium]|jgi:uncharacterized membrane-anchored protein YjiN (DUF445 family)|nr:DUF445 domain-containing protein [Candidatus Kapabacteria bacterium]